MSLKKHESAEVFECLDDGDVLSIYGIAGESPFEFFLKAAVQSDLAEEFDLVCPLLL